MGVRKVRTRALPLDARRAVPATAAGVGGAAVGNRGAATDPEKADEGRGEPDDGGQEAESNVGLVATAGVTAGADVAPVKDGTATITDKLEIALLVVILGGLTCVVQGQYMMNLR